MRIFEEQLISGEMSPEAARLQAYGTYLANGGTRDDFMDLTNDEVQLVYTVSAARDAKLVKDIVTGMAKAIGAMFGGLE